MRNKVQLIGHLGKDPDFKELESGKRLARFSLATSDQFKNANGEKVKETQWHTIVAWDKSAEFARKYLTKGCEVVVEGRLVVRNYNDKEGVKKVAAEVVVNEIMMIGSKKEK
jgi:single-strand DNA-binding protein